MEKIKLGVAHLLYCSLDIMYKIQYIIEILFVDCLKVTNT